MSESYLRLPTCRTTDIANVKCLLLCQNQEVIMKKILGVILLLGLFVAAQSVTYAQEKEADPSRKQRPR